MDPPPPRLIATSILVLLAATSLSGTGMTPTEPGSLSTVTPFLDGVRTDILIAKPGDSSGGGHSGSDNCLKCHTVEGKAPYPDTTAVVQSQIAWQRQNNARFAEWVEGRGNHVEGIQCSECHQPGNPIANYPVGGCDSTCHQWLQPIIEQDGFRTIEGTPTYVGTMDPSTLLAVVKDLDGDGRSHTTIAETFGCNGFCHNPGITVEAAEAWGGTLSGSTPGGVDPGLTPGTQHGLISRCTDCHRYGSPFGGPDDLHTTHAPLVQAEQPFTNMDAPVTQTACDYCHSAGPYPESPAGGCYNCHLSGHLPQTYYWGYPAEEMPGDPPARTSHEPGANP